MHAPSQRLVIPAVAEIFRYACLYHLGGICFVDGNNVAVHKTAFQSSTYGTNVASRAVDNNEATTACTLYTHSDQPWWTVDLGTPKDVSCVCVTNTDESEDG